MKRKALVLSAIAILAVMTITGVTLAFLTDNDVATNTFTIGNVDIKLLESTLHRQNDNASDDQIREDAKTYQKYLETAGENMVPGRWVKKAPYIENVGNNPAYVRIIVAIPENIDKVTDFMLYTTGINAGAFKITDSKTVDGIVYTTFTFTEPLQPGAVTYYAPFWQFKVKDTCDNADLVGLQKDLQGQSIAHKVVVTAEAIQSEGFKDATEAFAAFDAQMAEK